MWGESVSTITSNMGLLVPAVGDTDYPSSVSSSFTSVDNHDHTSGKGVQIPSQGIQDSAVTSGKINNGAVIDTKLATDSVTTAKIAANAVTRPKLEAVGQQISSSSGAFTTNSSSYVDVTNLSVSLTTTGRPVFIALVPDGSSNSSAIGVQSTADGTLGALFKILANSTDLGIIQIGGDAEGGLSGAAISYPPGSIMMISTLAAGTYTIKIQATVSIFSASSNAFVNFSKLIAYEL